MFDAVVFRVELVGNLLKCALEVLVKFDFPSIKILRLLFLTNEEFSCS